MKKLAINPKLDLVFDAKVREMCFSCKRYNKKATCPPHINTLEYYRDLLTSYANGILYYEEFVVEGNVRIQSNLTSLQMHKTIEVERLRLFNAGQYFVMGLGAGSCKLCTKCSFPCKLPGRALVPVEATGIDVVATMGRQGIAVKFPVKERFYRIGGIFYG